MVNTFLVISFDYPSDVSCACGIELGDEYVVTGGSERSHMHRATVARYSLSGDVEYLANLNQGRYYHACSKFNTANGETVSWQSIFCIILFNKLVTRRCWLLGGGRGTGRQTFRWTPQRSMSSPPGP